MAVYPAAVALVLLASCHSEPAKQPEEAAAAPLVEEVVSVGLEGLRAAEEDAWWSWQEARAQLAWGEQEEGNFAEALQLFEAVLGDLPPGTEETSPEFIAALEDGLGRACQGMGEMADAKTHLTRALNLRKSLENGDELVAQSRGHLGILALVQGDYAGAQRWVEGALESVGNEPSATRVFCLGLMGRYQMTVRNYGAARKAYDEAIELAEEIYGDDPATEDLEFDRLVVILRSEGSEEALKAIEYLNFDQKVEGTRLAARLNLRAELWREAGDLKKAEEDLREGIEVLQATLGNENEALAVYWANLGAILSEQKEWAKAKDCFEKVEGLSEQSGDWHQTRVEALWGRICCLVREGDQNGARTLLKDGMVRAEELLTRATSHSADGAKLNFRARMDPFSVLVELEEWEWLAEQLVKHKGSLLRGDDERDITWDEIRKGLQKDEVLIDALRFRDEANEWCYGALLSSAGVAKPQWVRLGTEKRLGRLILLQKALASLAREKAGMKVEPLLRDLYDDFWHPLSSQLPSGTRRVNLSPDGALGLIPWAVLRSKNERFLCEDLETFSLISNGRQALSQSENLSHAQWVSFGLSDFSNHRKNGPGEWWADVADLPGVQSELDQIGGETFLDRDATEARLTKLGRVPGVLHLATHGVFEGRAGQGGEGMDFEQEEQRGAILLEPGEGEDGVLRIFEIEKLNLKGCELVTVSSCQSGLGGMVSGEGVIGVSRAFLKAGAKRTMITLWEIRDSSTPDFVAGIYGRAMQMPPEEALWTEQRERMKDARNIDEAVLRYGGFLMTR